MRTCGIVSTYKKGCRCALCLAAYRAEFIDRTDERKAKDSANQRRQHLLRTYGMSLDDYEVMFKEQEGVCWICKRPQSPVGHNLAIDHNHTTQVVRGLLCHKCNIGVGFYEDYSQEMTEYLMFTQGFGDC